MLDWLACPTSPSPSSPTSSTAASAPSPNPLDVLLDKHREAKKAEKDEVKASAKSMNFLKQMEAADALMRGRFATFPVVTGRQKGAVLGGQILHYALPPKRGWTIDITDVPNSMELLTIRFDNDQEATQVANVLKNIGDFIIAGVLKRSVP